MRTSSQSSQLRQTHKCRRMADSAILARRVALITGASRGIGRAIAENLAAEGVRVVVNYPNASEEQAAMEVVSKICSLGGVAIAICADVRHVREIRSLFAQTLHTFSRLDILVGNAGGDAVVCSIQDTTEAEYDRVFALNSRGQFFVLQEAARNICDGGRIIIISTTTSSQPYAGTGSYAGAKVSSEIYARTLAREIGHRKVTVNIVSPGQTETQTMLIQTTLERRAYVASLTPLGRLGQPQDIADMVTFLASDAGRWVTGQNIHVNGGFL